MSNSRRSYLDTLNAGRERRPNLTLDELNRSLATLEERLQRPFDAAPIREAFAAHPAGADDKDALQAMVREVERARNQEDGVAAAGRIAGEIRNIRGDLSLQREAQRELSATLRAEFDTLRRELERSPHARADLNAEFARLSAAIQRLAERGEDAGVAQLQQEMADLRTALDQLARGDDLRSMETRWNTLEQRLGEFETKLSSENRAGSAALVNLHARLEGLNRTVGDLPTAQVVSSLDERLRSLAGSLDQVGRNQSQLGPEMLEALEGRLGEIDRTVKAAARPVAPDPKPLERIEAQLSAVSRQVGDLQRPEASDAVMQRLTQLSARVDDLAIKANLPAKAVEQLGAQVAIIAAKLDTVGAPTDPDFVFRAIEQRFDTLAAMLERRQGDATERAGLLFRDLERRLDDVVDRLDAQRAAASPENQNRALTDALDARFSDFAKRIESKVAVSPPMPAAEAKLMRSLEAQVSVLTEHLARPSTGDRQIQRLDSIERSLERQHEAVLKAAREAAESTVSALAASAADNPAVAALAQDLRALEAQVSVLTEHVTRPFAGERQLHAIAPQLESIERSIAGQHDAIMQAAREAAEKTVGVLAAGNLDGSAVAGLAEDLKSLETLTRRSDDRNAKTFEAIHDTLIKIVDRLGSLEAAETPEAPAARKIAIADAPSLDLAAPPELPVDFGGDAAQTAAALEVAAEGFAMPAEPAPRSRSMLGGLTRALGGRRERAQPAAEPVSEPKALAPAPTPEIDLDEPIEPTIANQLMEPGSGAPDLGAIMRRVRDERAQAPKAGKETEAARSDFIAAARRAAQAAAAEAEILKRQTDAASPAGGGKLAALLRAKRKTVLMAVGAVMIALAGIQATRFLGSDPSPEVAAVISAPASQAQAPAQAGAAALDSAEQEASAPVAASANFEADMAPAPESSELMEEPAAPPPAAAAADAAPAAAPAKAEAALPDMDQASPAPPQAEAPVQPQIEGKLPRGLEVPAAVGAGPLRDAAAKGDARAFWVLGAKLAEGRDMPADPAAAARWFEAAADGGVVPAQYRIGSIYEKGTGVERNPTVAKTWYQLAADAGNVSAMHNLAVLYAMGAAGPADNELAVRWFTAAADHGVKDSQFNLGILAAKGVGTKQNLEESYKWFALVAKGGDKDAAAKRDEVAAMLKPDALARARGAAELWKAKPADPATNNVDVPADWQAAPATTASVDMKAAVKTIQLILAKNGYDAGGTDGLMGTKTKAAIVAFQKDNKLPATGEVDDKLVKALLARK